MRVVRTTAWLLCVAPGWMSCSCESSRNTKRPRPPPGADVDILVLAIGRTPEYLLLRMPSAMSSRLYMSSGPYEAEGSGTPPVRFDRLSYVVTRGKVTMVQMSIDRAKTGTDDIRRAYRLMSGSARSFPSAHCPGKLVVDPEDPREPSLVYVLDAPNPKHFWAASFVSKKELSTDFPLGATQTNPSSGTSTTRPTKAKGPPVFFGVPVPLGQGKEEVQRIFECLGLKVRYLIAEGVPLSLGGGASIELESVDYDCMGGPTIGRVSGTATGADAALAAFVDVLVSRGKVLARAEDKDAVTITIRLPSATGRPAAHLDVRWDRPTAGQPCGRVAFKIAPVLGSPGTSMPAARLRGQELQQTRAEFRGHP